MKALLVNTSFYPEIGGVENSLRSISTVLSDQCWDVDVVCGDKGLYSSKEKLFGANVYRYKQRNKFKFLNLMVTLKRLKSKKHDLIITRHIDTTLALMLLGFSNVNYIAPGVYRYQNVGLKKGLFGKIKFIVNSFLETIVLSQCEHVYVFSETMRKQISSVAPTKVVEYLKPGVDRSRFYNISADEKREVRLNLGLPEEKKLVLYAGRFSDVKNLGVLIESFQYLPNNVVLVLVGDGPLRRDIIRLVDDLSLHERVIIHDKTTTPEYYYRASDIYCLPSTYEPFGQVLLEASFSKLPVVALDSNIKGVETATREIYEVANELVTYVEINEPKGFSTAIIKSLEKTNKHDSYSQFMKLYSWDSLIQHLLTKSTSG